MKYEFLKLMKNKIVLLCILFSFGISIYTGFKTAGNYDENKDIDYKTYTGEVTRQRSDDIENEYKVVMSNYAIAKNRVSAYEKDEVSKYATITEEDVESMSNNEKQKYSDEMYVWSIIYGNLENRIKSKEFRENVKKNSMLLAESVDIYTKSVNELAYKKYSKKVKYEVFGSTLETNLINGWTYINYSDYINIVCVIIVVCLIFLMEHSRNTYSMIFSSYNGRLKTYINKSIVITIISILLAVLTTIIGIIPYMGKRGFMQVMNADIQNFSEFIYSPYSLKLYQVILIMIALRIIAYVSIAAVLTFITTFFKKSIVPFSVGTLLFCGGFAMYSKFVDKMNLMEGSGRGISDLTGKYKLYRMYTPFGFLRNGIKYFSTYEPNNIINKPVMTVTIAVCIHIMYIVVFFVAGYLVYRFRFRKKGV